MTSSLTYVLIIALLLRFRSVYSGRSRIVKFPQMWIIPALFLFMLVQDLIHTPTIPLVGGIVFAACSLAGLVYGMLRGKMLRFTLDEKTGAAVYRDTYQGLLLFLAVVIAKLLIQYLFTSTFSDIVSLALVFFACATIIGKSAFITRRHFAMTHAGD